MIPTGRFPGLIVTAIAGRHLRRALTATQQCSPSSISERTAMSAKRRTRGAVEPTAGREGHAGTQPTGPQLIGPRVLGPTVMAPLALAAAAIGALAIGRLAIAEAVVRRLRAGEVTIRSLKVGELEVGGQPWPGPANTIDPGR